MCRVATRLFYAEMCCVTACAVGDAATFKSFNPEATPTALAGCAVAVGSGLNDSSSVAGSKIGRDALDGDAGLLFPVLAHCSHEFFERLAHSAKVGEAAAWRCFR